MQGAGIQAVIFRKQPRYQGDPYWTQRNAEAYLQQHELYPIKPVHETTNFYRYRITDPKIYKRLYTINHNNGMMLIVGKVKKINLLKRPF